MLVSEILLKRTTASAVKNMYEEFMSLYPNIQELAKADEKKLEKLLLKIGYHKRRTKILIEIANYVLDKYNGQIPKSKEALLTIPYVGQYTANAILSLGYGIPSAMVDSNVERIIKRLFFTHLSKKAPLRLVQKIADTLCLKENHQNYNYALLDLGAIVCRYGIPKCKVCPINKFCDYYLSKPPFSS
jgi:A/G-specific adenine glycosylase